MVADRDLHRHEHAGCRHAAHHLQPLDREIAGRGRVALGGAVDQPQFGTGGGEPTERFGRVVGRFPLVRPKIAHEPNDVGSGGAAVSEQFGDGGERLPRAGGGLRWGAPGKFVADPLHEFRRDRLPLDVEGQARRAAGGICDGRKPRKPPDREFLPARGGRQFTADPFHHELAAVEGGLLAEPPSRRKIAHRIAVVEQHEVRGAAPAEQLPEGVLPTRLRERQHHSQHRGHPQQEQQDLLEQHAGAVLPLAGQQQFHRRPRHLLVPQQVDEMDDDGGRDQRQTPPEQRQKIERRHRVPYTAMLERRERNLTSAASTASPVRINE